MKKLIATLLLSIFYILPVRAIDITNGSVLSNYWINSSTSYIMDLVQDIRDGRSMVLSNAALGKILFGGGHTINAFNGSALFFYRPTTNSSTSKGHLFFQI